MHAIRSLSIFGGLYCIVLINCSPLNQVFGLAAAAAITTGFLAVFPIYRVHALFRWATESKKLSQNYRTCVVTSPLLDREERSWRFVGYVKEQR